MQSEDSTQPLDERTLLKVSLKGSSKQQQPDEEGYRVSLLNAEDNREFSQELDEGRPAYFQLALFQDRNPRKARQLHFSKGDLVGVMQGRFELPDTLR